jgi:hypothetical protein
MIRLFWRGCLVALMALVLASTASTHPQKDKGKESAGSGVKLAWTAFDQLDKPFYQEMTTETEQKMTVMGMEVKQTQTQTFTMEWKPVKKDDKTWTVEQKIIGVKMNINIGGNNIAYDSTAKDQPANPLTDFFKALVGAKFDLTINKEDMKITKIDGRKDFIDKLVKANQQLDTLLKQILSEDALKQMADPTFNATPPKGAVPSDKTWEKKDVKLDMGPIGVYDTTYKYKLTEVKDDLATISVETTLKYTAPQGKQGGALPFTITKGKLEGKSEKGTIVFDIKAGRIKSSAMELKLNGSLTIEIAGQPTDVTLDQTQKSTLKTLEKNPLPQ